ncbi:collagen alpha-1(XIX) chain-like [Oncorhynchus masou masou]|uniref:collagen alpha-1(XIX) chain-like n=1 Tax=Oncorhynchus masou masou TaxID=90313 RepID=UPI003183F5F0
MYIFTFRLVFPNGLSSEYSLVTTFRLRKTTKKDRWYLWQIFDQTGGTQVSVVLDGAKRAVEFSARGLLKNSLHYTFKSRDLHTLFDRQWHKLGVAVQSSIVSIYMDCKLIERRLTDEKHEIDPSGYTLITTRVEDGRPVDIELQQILIYCDPYLAEMETCCEQAGSTCEPSREGPGAGGVTPNPLDTDGAGQLPGCSPSPSSQLGSSGSSIPAVTDVNVQQKRVIKVYQAWQDFQDRKAIKETRERPGKTGSLETQARRVTRVFLVHQVWMVFLDRR